MNQVLRSPHLSLTKKSSRSLRTKKLGGGSTDTRMDPYITKSNKFFHNLFLSIFSYIPHENSINKYFL